MKKKPINKEKQIKICHTKRQLKKNTYQNKDSIMLSCHKINIKKTCKKIILEACKY
jgi:hypothetical protein